MCGAANLCIVYSTSISPAVITQSKCHPILLQPRSINCSYGETIDDNDVKSGGSLLLKESATQQSYSWPCLHSAAFKPCSFFWLPPHSLLCCFALPSFALLASPSASTASACHRCWIGRVAVDDHRCYCLRVLICICSQMPTPSHSLHLLRWLPY